jgi:uncharacterized membrane protein YphA (DoxX/SURF4 family)
MKTFDHRLNESWWALRVALGMMPIVSGVDKFVNKLTDWGDVPEPLRDEDDSGEHSHFMHLVGIVEVVVGVIVLSRWTRIGSYVVMLWLIAIAANLMTTACSMTLQCAILKIAVGAFALSHLTTVREDSALAAKKSGPGINSRLANTM